MNYRKPISIKKIKIKNKTKNLFSLIILLKDLFFLMRRQYCNETWFQNIHSLLSRFIEFISLLSLLFRLRNIIN